MINKQRIQSNLKQLNNLYNNSKGLMQPLYFSKLAVLEVCGWVEESMDDVIITCAKRHLRQPEHIRFVENQVVRRVHGFDYDQHFRSMLIQVIGIISVERLERQLNETKFDIMKSALISLKESRDKQAHTHLKDATATIDAPSATQGRFHDVYHGLKDFESCVRRLKLCD